MTNNQEMFVLCCLLIITASLVMPAYAEVTSVKTDKPLYKKNIDKIIVFTGTAEDGDINELVTVVINDPADNFVVLRQGYIGIEKTFEVKFTDKDLAKFSSHGIYNATAFIVNKTEGVTMTFDFSLDGSPVIHPTAVVPTETPTATPEPDISEPEPVPVEDDVATAEEKSIHEKIKERIEAAKKKQTQAITEVQNNTTVTAENSTINELPKQEDDSDIETSRGELIIKESQLDSNLLYTVIGIGSAGAAGAVVYGMKNKFKHKVDYSSYFTSPEKTETPKPSTQEYDYALMILKNRLAKGEITVDEFNELKNVLKEP